MENLTQVADLFKLLSASRRLQLLVELAEKPQGVDALQDRCGATRTNVVKHLNACLKAGVVSRERVGDSHVYRLAQPWIADLIHEALALYAKNK